MSSVAPTCPPRHSSTLSSVVDIGGAPFVPPLRSRLQGEEPASRRGALASSSMSISPPPYTGPSQHRKQASLSSIASQPRQRVQAGIATDIASPSVSPEASLSSPLSSAASSSPATAESSYTLSPSPASPDQFEAAALSYSSSMREHTQRMWERERNSIERNRLGVAEGNASSNNTARATATTAEKTASSASTRDGNRRDSPVGKRNAIITGFEALFHANRRKPRPSKTALLA